MRPIALRMHRFRSFEDEQAFVFPQAPGLYFMTGVNEVDTRLGANGAGKSSIWDALVWVLFGVTARGLSAGNVCSWNHPRGTWVELDFLQEGVVAEPWTVRRSWGPNSWTLTRQGGGPGEREPIDLVKDGTNPVLAELRLDLEPFLQAVLMAQRRPMFLDLRAEPQASLFSGVLGLDQWVAYSKAAAERASAQDRVTRGLETDLARAEGALERCQTATLREDVERWEAEQRKQIEAVDAQIRDGLLAIKQARAKIPGLEKDLEASADTLQKATASERYDQEDLNKAEAVADGWRATLMQARVDATTAERRAKDLRGDGGKCPTCGQRMTSTHAHASSLGAAEREAREARQELEKVETVERGATNSVQDLRKILQESQRAKAKALDDYRAADADLARARLALRTLEREVERDEDRLELLQAAENPFQKRVDDLAEESRVLRAKVAELRARMDRSAERTSLYNYWVKGFKDIRLQEISTALNELEIEVNNGVAALGLVDWSVRFGVDRENKSGGVQRGFSVTVQSPQYPRPTPWESWSGGEGQRLRIAGNLGLSDLIRRRCGATIPLEVWDEPTQGLSPEGITDLLDALAERARLEGRQIWIVDHKAHDYGGFQGTATVIKRPKGSVVRTAYNQV